MTGHPSSSCADQRWVEAMFADLQRQLDDLSGQLQALGDCVLASQVEDSGPAPHVDGCDG